MAQDPGVPLASYMTNPGEYGVRFECKACQLSYDLPIDRVVERLKAAGLGDERTGVKAVAHLATKPCPRCGKMAWETRPAHHPRPPPGGGSYR